MDNKQIKLALAWTLLVVCSFPLVIWLITEAAFIIPIMVVIGALSFLIFQATKN